MCNDDEWKYDSGFDHFEGPIDENPVGVEGVFC